MPHTRLSASHPRPTRSLAVVLLLLASGAATALGQFDPGGAVRVTMAYPTGDPATSIVVVEHIAPSDARVGREFDYILRLTNRTSGEIRGLVLTVQAPPNLDVRGYDPIPTSSQLGSASWEVPAMTPGAPVTVRLRCAATRVGDISVCAAITFRAEGCAQFTVVEPALRLAKSAPREVIACDPITLTYLVTNPGSGAARNVQVFDPLPEGWRTEDGRQDVVLSAGDLLPGQSKQASVRVRAAGLGDFASAAQARSDDGLTSEVSTSTRIVRCNLQVTATSPDVRFIGRPANFEFAVVNSGDAPARDTVLVHTLPAGGEFVRASDNGQVGGNQVQWSLGTLGPGERRSVSLVVVPREIGQSRADVFVRGYCCEGRGEALLQARGIPAILLEVIDLDDPVEVGAASTYEITVVNQGSADDTNIVIACTLPPQIEFVGADGPTGRATLAGATVTFAPVPRLAPKATVKFRVQVRGVSEGDIRFGVSMNSDNLDRPVEETESTRVYQ